MRAERFDDPDATYTGLVISYDPTTGIGFIRTELDDEDPYAKSAKYVTDRAAAGQRVKFFDRAWRGADSGVVRGMTVNFHVAPSGSSDPDELWVEADSVWPTDEDSGSEWKVADSEPGKAKTKNEEDVSGYAWAADQFKEFESGF